MTEKYMLSLDESLMKVVRDSDEGIFTGYIWNRKTHEWGEHWDLVAPYYFGEEPARTITKEKADEFIKEHSI